MYIYSAYDGFGGAEEDGVGKTVLSCQRALDESRRQYL